MMINRKVHIEKPTKSNLLTMGRHVLESQSPRDVAIEQRKHMVHGMATKSKTEHRFFEKDSLIDFNRDLLVILGGARAHSEARLPV